MGALWGLAIAPLPATVAAFAVFGVIDRMGRPRSTEAVLRSWGVHPLVVFSTLFFGIIGIVTVFSVIRRTRVRRPRDLVKWTLFDGKGVDPVALIVLFVVQAVPILMSIFS